jgi:hypothetical protein
MFSPFAVRWREIENAGDEAELFQFQFDAQLVLELPLSGFLHTNSILHI